VIDMDKPFTFKAYDFNLTAGGSQTILAGGEYFRILSATGAIDLTVEGKGTMPDLLPGQAIKGLPFDRLVLRDKSGAPNSGSILVASSEFQDNKLQGAVSLTGQGGSFTQGSTSVGSGSAVTLLAAKPTRRRLLVQNNTAAQILRVTIDGSAPTASSGLRLLPGDLLDLSDFCPTGAVNAIFESGSAANVDWAEG